ncbi:MAG: type II secretion system F family protein [Bacteroidota bacterium]
MAGVNLSELTQVYQPNRVDKAVSSESIWQKEIRLGPAITLKDRQKIYQMLGTLLGAGLSLLDSLKVLIDQSSKKAVKELLVAIHRGLEDGKSLSQTLAEHPKWVSPFEIQSLHMGEETGKMGEILTNLSELYQKRLLLKRKLTQALSYPIAVIAVAGIVLGFMIGYVVPMFEDIFNRFDAELPKITQTILALSTGFREHAIIWIPGLIGIGLGIYFLKRDKKAQKVAAKVLLRVPMLGPLYLKLQLSRLFYSFHLLLSARVNLDQSLVLLEPIVNFPPIRQAIGQIRQEVVDGSTLYDAVSQHSIFPAYVRQIVKVGETTASLDQMFLNLAQSLEAESEGGIQTLTQFLEPLLIILLGGMVAVILTAMYLPMFELSNAINT